MVGSEGEPVAQQTNRLIDETSPYLRQHAHNPVEWYPWGEEAFEKARRENKPILLSVGYSACHWCHVMERESFEDEETARVMNEHFVNVKVDREERPDVDQIYMNAVQMLTGRGGWPMTVFLTPEREPFYGGTYFPPEDRHGMPGFRRVLAAMARAYREKPDDVKKTVGQLMSALRGMEPAAAGTPVDERLVTDAAARLAGAYDETHGGLGQAPKFPNEAVLDLFLRAHRRTGESKYLDMVLHTLQQMARGGIYDQLGGGFHRYSVDAAWLVPHFEKMLYDNAQLVPLYLSAFQISDDAFFARIVRETLDYVIREMRHPSGGFFSTQDADSEGEEGKFFVWTADEVRRIVGDDDAEAVCRYWDVTDAGNFEGTNILHITLSVEQLAKLHLRELTATKSLIAEARQKLWEAREQRVRPGLDDKILTSWNGLMISAFAMAAEVLGEKRYQETAVDGVAFVESALQRGDRLLSTCRDGTARLNGYLDDYAFFVAALLDVFELVHERRYLDRAVTLTDSMITHFADASAGGFFFTSDDHEELIVRNKPVFDGSIPSGNSVAARNLLRLHHHTGREEYRERAETLLQLYARQMREQPFGFANLLCVADLYTATPHEIVLVGAPDAPETAALLQQIGRVYLPNRTLRVIAPEGAGDLPEWLRGKGRVDERTTVYVCRSMTCSPPATTWEELRPLLDD
jgi:uncharacterized protein YyaL (SSP411 family)